MGVRRRSDTTPTFDVNGWDLAKTFWLIANGNATAIEWLRSPIVYSGERAGAACGSAG